MLLITTTIVAAVLSLLSHFDRSSHSDALFTRFQSYGDASKPAIVLIPGLDGAAAFFADVIPELTPKYHVVMFHLPLVNRSRPIEEYTFASMAKALAKVVDELRISPAVVVGESFGGVVAQRFALDHPAKVRQLVLLSSLAKTELPPEVQWKLDYLLPVIRFVGGFFPSVAQALFAQIHVYDVVEPHEGEHVKRLFIKEATFAHFFSVMARIGIVSKLNIEDEVTKIRAPTLIVYGSDDHFTKTASLRLTALIKSSQLASLPGGHLPHVTSPRSFAQLIDKFASSFVSA